MLGINGEYTGVHPKAKFKRFLVESRKKSAVKEFIEKPILHNFVNLSATFCLRFYFEKHLQTTSSIVPF